MLYGIMGFLIIKKDKSYTYTYIEKHDANETG